MAFWENLGLDSGSTVFVPLCGKSRDLTRLHEQGYMALGIELSEIAVKVYFEENGIIYHQQKQQQASPFSIWRSGMTKLFCGDFFALKPADLESVHAVYDRAPLIALPPEMRQRYVNILTLYLKKESGYYWLRLSILNQKCKAPRFPLKSLKCLICIPHFTKLTRCMRKIFYKLKKTDRKSVV